MVFKENMLQEMNTADLHNYSAAAYFFNACRFSISNYNASMSMSKLSQLNLCPSVGASLPLSARVLARAILFTLPKGK